MVILDLNSENSQQSYKGMVVTERKQLTLGKALYLLLNTNEHAFNSAANSLQSETTPLTLALTSLLDAINGSGELNAGEKCKNLIEIMTPLESKLLRREKSEEKKAALRILSWLAKGSLQELFQRALVEQLQGQDKRSKLGVILLLDHLLSQAKKVPSTIVGGPGIREVEDDQEELFSIGTSTLIISALSDLVHKDSKLAVDGTLEPTTLTTTAVTVALHISRRVVTVKREEASTPFNLKHIAIIQDIVRIIKQLEEWYHSYNAFLYEGLEEVVKILEHHIRVCATANTLVDDGYSTWWPLLSLYVDPQNLRLSECSLQRHINKLFDKENGQLLEAYHHLVCCALFFGYRDELFWKRLRDFKIVDGPEAMSVDKAFLRLIETVINDAGSDTGSDAGYTMAFSMLKAFVDKSNNSQLMLESMLSYLLTLLDEDDAVSKAAIRFLADCFPMYSGISDEIIHHATSRLDSEEFAPKKNAMHLLERIFRCHYGVFLDRQTPENRDSLREKLFVRMSDEQVVLRSLAAKLLAYFDPLDTFSRLSRHLVHRNPAIRASAGSALTLMLKEHSRDAKGILSLLDLLRNLSKSESLPKPNLGMSAPSNPGQIRSNATVFSNHNDQQDTHKQIDRLFDLIKKWSTSIPDQVWSSLVHPLLKKSYAFPKDAILIRFWNTISEALGRNPLSVDVLLSEITEILTSQPTLTKEILDSNTEESSLEMQSLLFLRLHPLLILKTLPVHCFDHLALTKVARSSVSPVCSTTSTSQTDPQEHIIKRRKNYVDSFSAQLYKRCSNDLEFPQIRTMALEILARIPGSIHWIANQLNALCKTTPKDYLNIKHWIFGFCQWLIQTFDSQKRQAILGKLEIEITQEVISDNFSEILRWGSTDESLHKLQLGCMDTLSLMLVLCGSEVLKGSSSIVEIEDKLPDPSGIKKALFEFTLHFVLLNLVVNGDLDEVRGQLSTCMANVIVMTIKRLSNQPLGATGQVTNADFDENGLRGFAERTIPALNNTINIAIENPKFATSGAACFQGLFHYSYLIPKHINRGELIELAIKGMRSSEKQLRVGSLKLLMSLLAAGATNHSVDYALSPITINQLREGILALRRNPNEQELNILIDRLENILDSC